MKAIHERDMAEGWGRVQMPNTWTASTLRRLPTGGGNGFFHKRSGG